MSVRGYTVAFDWSQAGVFNRTGEDVSSRVQKGDIEVSYGRNMDGGVMLSATSGSAGVALNNQDRYLSPENTSSPLTGKIIPGRGALIQKMSPTGQLYTLLSGTLDTYKISADPARTFSAQILDGWGQPGAEKLSTPLYSGIRTGAAINVVLDAINWTGPRDIDAGATLMPWWWEEGNDANTAIDRIVASEGAPAIACVEGGAFVFRDRHHRLLNSRSQTPQATCTHIEPAGSGPVGDLKIERDTWDYDHGINNIANSAIFAVDIRGPGMNGEVWTTEDAITIASGATMVQTVQSSDPFFNAITPEIGTDIQLQSGTVSSVSLSRDSGQSTVLSITCSADTVITRLALRATPVPIRRTVVVSASDPSSIGIFKTKSWPDEANPVWAGPYDAQAIATRIVATYANYRPVIRFTVYAINDTYLAKLLDLKISDRVTVRHDPTGVNRDFMIERKAHRITGLHQHRVTLWCVATEPVQPANAFTFDVAGKGFDQGLFAVEGIDNAASMFRFDTAGQGFDQGLFAT